MADRRLRAVTITVSNDVASGADEDRAGPVAVGRLREAGHDADHRVVPDDPARIEAAILDAIRAGSRIVLVCGGTGIGPHDLTPQVVKSLLSFEIPGIAEEIRRHGLAHTPRALISRELAGAVVLPGQPPALVLAVPGSRGGVRDAIEVIGDQLDYIVEQLDGAGHA